MSCTESVHQDAAFASCNNMIVVYCNNCIFVFKLFSQNVLQKKRFFLCNFVNKSAVVKPNNVLAVEATVLKVEMNNNLEKNLTNACIIHQGYFDIILNYKSLGWQ